MMKNSKYPQISQALRMRRLQPPSHKIQAVLDTDTFNEIDDPFAIAYSVLSKEKIELKALYAAPFLNKRAKNAGDGMEKSYIQALKVLKTLNVDSNQFAFRGSEQFFKSPKKPITSAAAEHLVSLAHRKRDGVLYVIGIAGLTNIASAILLDPAIVTKIAVVWLGGNAPHLAHQYEFNLAQDKIAAKIVLESGVPLIQIPAEGVTSHLITSLAELQAHLKTKNDISQYLLEIFRDYRKDHYGWSKVIWDIAAVAWLVNPEWLPSEIVRTPKLNSNLNWPTRGSRPASRLVLAVNRNQIFSDMFRKLNQTN